RINLNSKADARPIWAALFAGIPIRTSSRSVAGAPKDAPFYLDVQGSGVLGDYPGQLDPAFPQSMALGRVIASRGGTYYGLGGLTSIPELSDLPSIDPKLFPKKDYEMKSDEDKELMLSQIINLVSTEGSGSLFTIWAWGQALRGPNDPKFNQKRIVAA